MLLTLDEGLLMSVSESLFAQLRADVLSVTKQGRQSRLVQKERRACWTKLRLLELECGIALES